MFDKNRCIENIYALAKKKKMKIGELEEKAGVSKGYLSRINKEDSATNPPIDFLVSIAEQLDVSLDYLTTYSEENFSANETFVVEFIDRLTNKTISGELEWVVQSMGMLTAENDNKVDNPLIDVIKDYSEYDTLGPCHRYTSYFYDEGTVVNGDAFYCTPMRDSTARVYIMKVLYLGFDSETANDSGSFFEVYFYINDVMNTICSTAYVKSGISSLVERLYETIDNTSSRLGLSSTTKTMMRRFLDS